MKRLGITYQKAVPQSLYDSWWFFNCENVPDPLPEYLRVMDVNPFDAIGYGLRATDAAEIACRAEELKK